MKIKSLDEPDKNAVLDLFSVAFGKTMSERYWTWRYLENPFIDDKMIHLMWDGDILAGHYAVSPVMLVIEGENVLTALSMTTMTHPDYAGKGIFTTLANSLYEEINEKYFIDFVWGFPNANSHYGFIKNLKWQDVGVIPFLSKRVDISSLNISEEYSVLNFFTEEMIHALNDNGAQVRILKCKKYMDWRYLTNPSFDYKLISAAGGKAFAVVKFIPSFFEKGKMEADIMEVFCGNDLNNLQRLEQGILSYAKEQSLSLVAVNLWHALSSKSHILFEKLGFKLSGPVTFLSGRSLKQNKVLGDPRSWDISMGYSDVF
jgi:hypothetical protein